ncbi:MULTISPECIES: hypothetical protein [Arthrobacter]|uniref:hypothetical protein n=1 Tax=Arthrobacter TaxID=1663 RepID=UPI002158E22C|nr:MULTISPECIES: hypothetical protein [Arthrobacter]
MRTFAAFRRATGLTFTGLALIGTLFTGSALVGSCRGEQACTEIAPAQVVTLSVAAGYAGLVQTVHLKACQADRCSEAALELVPGRTAVDLGCAPGSVGDRPCSATSSPDGTLTGMLMFEGMNADSIHATASGTDTSGHPLPLRTITFTPRVTYPFGEQCARFITANLVLDAGGLRQA